MPLRCDCFCSSFRRVRCGHVATSCLPVMSLVCFCGATRSLFSLRATEHAVIPGARQPCSEGGPRCGCVAVAGPLLFVSRAQTRLWGPLDRALVVRSAHRRPACWARDSGTVRLTSSHKAPIISAPVHCSRLYTVPCVVLPAPFMPQDASAVSAVPVLCSSSSPYSRHSALSTLTTEKPVRVRALAVAVPRCAAPVQAGSCSRPGHPCSVQSFTVLVDPPMSGPPIAAPAIERPHLFESRPSSMGPSGQIEIPS